MHLNQKILKWKPKYNFIQMINEMVNYEVNQIKNLKLKYLIFLMSRVGT